MNNRELTVGGKNSHTLDFASATRPEMIEGHGYRFIMLDEAGIVFRRPSSESFYNSTLLPMLMDFEDSKLFLLGTPKGVNNLYHQLWLKARAGVDGYYSRTVSSYENPFFTDQQVANAMEELSGPYRRQEVFGEFIAGAESAVSFSDVVRLEERPQNLSRIAMGVDFASSVSAKADFTGIVIAGIDEEGYITVLHAEEMKGSFHTILERIIWLGKQYPLDALGVEDTTFQVWAGQELIRKTDLPVILVKPSKKSVDFIGGSSKEYRFIPIAAKYNQKLIRHAPGLHPAFENQLFQFPLVEHDDMIDAEVIAVSLLMRPAPSGTIIASGIESSPIEESISNTCGGCRFFQDNFCSARHFTTGKHEPSCPSFQPQ